MGQKNGSVSNCDSVSGKAAVPFGHRTAYGTDQTQQKEQAAKESSKRELDKSDGNKDNVPLNFFILRVNHEYSEPYSCHYSATGRSLPSGRSDQAFFHQYRADPAWFPAGSFACNLARRNESEGITIPILGPWGTTT